MSFWFRIQDSRRCEREDCPHFLYCEDILVPTRTALTSLPPCCEDVPNRNINLISIDLWDDVVNVYYNDHYEPSPNAIWSSIHGYMEEFLPRWKR